MAEPNQDRRLSFDPLITGMRDSDERDLMKSAFSASFKAYAPASQFFVGAAVRTGSGQTHVGSNVENDSYGLTSCAERNAVFAAVGREGEAVTIVAAALWARSDHWDCVTVSPCGACRQVLAQFSFNAKVTFLQDSRIQTTPLTDLLPAPFELKEKPSPDPSPPTS